MPFEIKSIYGLSNKNELEDKVSDVKGIKGEDNDDKECTICMSE